MQRRLLAELKACSVTRNLEWGRRLHEATLRTSGDLDVCIENALISMYGRCGSLMDAYKVFDGMKIHTVDSWNALILGYAENGKCEMALEVFTRMMLQGCVPNTKSFIAALKSCTGLVLDMESSEETSRERGKSVHLLASVSCCDADIYVKSSLLDMYARCRSMKDARKIFESMSSPDVVCWTSLLLGYANNGEGAIALDLFVRMRNQGCEPDGRVLVAAVKACTELASIDEGTCVASKGKALDLLVWRTGYESDIYVKAALIDMYGKCGSIKCARAVFDSIKHPNVVCWTVLILGYADNGVTDVALEVFSRMKNEGIAPDSRTFVAALKAVSAMKASRQRGKSLHLLASRSGCDSHCVKIALLDMYGRLGLVEEARAVFDRMNRPDVASWTTLMFVYVDNGQGELALKLLSRMNREGCEPVARTLVAALVACIEKINERMGSGSVVRLLVWRYGLHSDIFVMNSLVDLYAKSGRMQEAKNVFDSIEDPDLISWSALILGYVNTGEGDAALDLFSNMKHQGCPPDEITFVSVLKACGMLGALEVGKAIHLEISTSGMERDVVLANCLVDFYAKCGSLVEADKAFEHHVSRDLVTWTALMTGYSCHGNIEGVFELFEKMKSASIRPDGVTFNCILTACSHAGLVDRGKDYFEAMSTEYGLQPGVEHYTCMLDILGRANKLDDAMLLLRSMPFDASVVMWMSVLGACRKWGNLQLGSLAFESLKSLDGTYSGSYALMANLY